MLHLAQQAGRSSTAQRISGCAPLWFHATAREAWNGKSLLFGDSFSRGEPSELLCWFLDQGGECFHGLEVVKAPGAGWGLKIADGQSCPAGAVLTSTPSKLLFRAEPAESDAHAKQLVPGERVPGVSQRLRWQLVEAALATRDKQECAQFGAWVRAVQVPPGLPLFNVTEEGYIPDALKFTGASATAVSLRRALRKEAMEMQASSAVPPEVLWAAMLWAQGALMSRAAILPRDSSRLVLAPIADFANHAPTFQAANAELQAREDGSVALVSRRIIPSGEEIRHCYAEMCNEQLLFSYGMVLDNNSNGGPICPVSVPDTPARARVWYQVLAELRSEKGACSSGAAVAGPRLGHPDSSEDPAAELLLALAASDLSEAAAASLLHSARSAGRKSLRRLAPRLRTGLPELLATLHFLSTWEARLQSDAQPSDSPSSEFHEESLEPARKLQVQTLAAVSGAANAVMDRLPLPVRAWKRIQRTLSRKDHVQINDLR